MKKILIALFILAVSFHCSFSQNYKVNWGPANERVGGYFSDYLQAGHYADGYYIFMQPGLSYSLAFFDTAHQMKYLEQKLFNYNEKHLVMKSVISTRTKNFAYLPYWDLKTDKFHIVLAEIKDGKPGALEKKYETSVFSKYRAYYKNNRDLTEYKLFGLPSLNEYFDFFVTHWQEYKVSPNKKFVAFVGTGPTGKAKNEFATNVAVFDENMNLVWDKEIPFVEKKSISPTGFVITDNGNIFIAGKVIEDHRGYNYYYKLLGVSNNGSLQEYEINIGADKIPTETGIILNKKTNDIILTGFYADKTNPKGYNGIFNAILSKQSGKVVPTVVAFSSDFLSGLATEKEIAKGKGLSDDFFADNFICLDDGSFTFVAQNCYKTMKTDVNGRDIGVDSYYSLDFVIPRFKNSGELLALEKVANSTKTIDSKMQSHVVGAFNNKLYIVSNDTKGKGISYELMDMEANVIVIGVDGKLQTRQKLFTPKEAKLFLNPFMSFQLDDKLMLFGFWKKDFRYGSLKLE